MSFGGYKCTHPPCPVPSGLGPVVSFHLPDNVECTANSWFVGFIDMISSPDGHPGGLTGNAIYICISHDITSEHLEAQRYSYLNGDFCKTCGARM